MHSYFIKSRFYYHSTCLQHGSTFKESYSRSVIDLFYQRGPTKWITSFCWRSLLEYINYSPWRLHFKGWNMLELLVLIKWWFKNIWVHLSVFIWYSDISACIWTRYISAVRCSEIAVKSSSSIKHNEILVQLNYK